MAINSVTSGAYDYVEKYQDAIEKNEGDSRQYEQSVRRDWVTLSVREIHIEEGCSTYEDIKASMKDIRFVNRNRLFYETSSIMESYYNGEMNKEDLRQKIENYVQEFTGGVEKCKTPYAANQVKNTFSTLYEYFSRANVRCAVNKNNEEASSYWLNNGVKTEDMDSYTKLKSTVYYNADYYYKSEEMQEFFRDTFDEMADTYGVGEIDYEMIEKNTSFTLDGGLSFNGVWNWSQWQTNHSWMSAENSTSIIDNDFVPPRDFVYAYTNGVSKDNVDGLLKYAKSNQEDKTAEKTDAGQTAKRLLVEIKYGGAFSWGKNSRITQKLEKENWKFLMPSSKSGFGNYFRMLRYARIQE